MRARAIAAWVCACALAAGPAAPGARAQTPPETSPEQPSPGQEPSPKLPIPERRAEEETTLVPLPIVYSDPNVGVGFGVMPVILIHPKRRIEWIIAPSLDYNDVVGAAATSRVFFYPTAQEELVAYNAVTTGRNMEHSIHFRGRDRLFEGSDNFARGYYIVDATRRFFGIGPETDEDDETDYELEETGIEGDLGYRFWDVLRLSATTRYRRTNASAGDLDDLVDTVDAFPTLSGVGRGDVELFAYGARLTLDLRDDFAVPSDGLFAEAFFELAFRGIVGDTKFQRWGAQVVHHLPIVRPGRWVNVVRARYSAIDGDRRFPFWELPSLGGAENLRGFGAGRFTDERSIVLSAEERVRCFEMIIRDNRVIIEAAPFIDAGRVFGRSGPLSRHDWEIVPGVGIRMLLPDSAIVARFDFGRSKDEGTAVFVVLGYPF